MSKDRARKMEIVENPMNPILVNGLAGMPGLPTIIQNALPVPIPQMTYDQGPLSMIFGNFKRKRMEVALELESRMAEHSYKTVKAKLDTIHEVLTFSARVADTLGAYEHNKAIRSMALQEGNARLRLLDLEAQEKGATVQKIQTGKSA
jgi:hypothetical protein